MTTNREIIQEEIIQEEIIQEVASSTGRNVLVVERVFDLMRAAADYGHILMVEDDRLTDAIELDSTGPLPADLREEIMESGLDVIELKPVIMRAVIRMLTRHGLREPD